MAYLGPARQHMHTYIRTNFWWFTYTHTHAHSHANIYTYQTEAIVSTKPLYLQKRQIFNSNAMPSQHLMNINKFYIIHKHTHTHTYKYIQRCCHPNCSNTTPLLVFRTGADAAEAPACGAPFIIALRKSGACARLRNAFVIMVNVCDVCCAVYLKTRLSSW
jgi:hypothetical protein